MQMQDILLVLQKQVDKMKLTKKLKTTNNKKKYYKTRKALTTTQFKDFCLAFSEAIKKQVFVFTFYPTIELEQILNLLEDNHYIAGYLKEEFGLHYQIYLPYDIQGRCTIQNFIPISKTKQRLTISYKNLKTFENHFPTGLMIIRTNIGILSSNECLVKRIGGEVLFYIN